jgi:hypothetical protein
METRRCDLPRESAWNLRFLLCSQWVAFPVVAAKRRLWETRGVRREGAFSKRCGKTREVGWERLSAVRQSPRPKFSASSSFHFLTTRFPDAPYFLRATGHAIDATWSELHKVWR